MAFKKTFTQRLFNLSRITSPLSLSNCRISSSSSAVKALASQNANKIAPDPGDDGIFRRFLHRRPIYQSPAISSELRSLPIGENLLDKLRETNFLHDRIRLDVLRPPAEEEAVAAERKLTVEDARKMLRLLQLEIVKEKLMQVEENCISHEEFVKLCKNTCFSDDQGLEMAKMLDELGIVIVLGNFVFLRPQQVMKAIQGLMPIKLPQSNHPPLKELQEMEKQKTAIDKKAELLVRRELWCGLGCLFIQTAAFMRLTFWELTWDVMEPICFFLTSIYFMAGYGFFLRTSKEPTFQGFSQTRFSVKQKRLMKIHNFDLDKYNELIKACYPHSSFDKHVR